MREQHKLKNGGRERSPEVGEIVLVFGENMKRGLWKMGKVEELIAGKDGVVRGAKVRVISKGKPVY